ncbi:MAG: ferritin family protein [Thermodesulfobacteriota bacterium]
MFTLTDVLSIAITIEENGEASYRSLASRSTAPAVRAALLQLAEDEAAHARTFAGWKKEFTGVRVSSPLEKMARLMLKEAVGDRSFGLDEVAEKDLASVSDCLKLAANLEEDTVVFYETLAPFLPPDPQTEAGLLRIIEEEKKHKKKLGEMLASC